MKRIFTIILVMLSLLCAPLSQAQVYWDGTIDKSWTGTGTAADPIQIATAQQLAGFADSVNRGDDFSGRYIELTADIYLSDSTLGDSLKHEWEHPIGQFQSGGEGWEYTLDTAWFRGNFDGKNHTIYNLFHGTTPETPDWNNPDNPFGDMDAIDFSGWDRALFGFVENATIKNVRLENAVVTGASKIATLALEVRGNSLIENCHTTGYVNAVAEVGGSAGGLIAYLTSGQVINCSADVTTLGMRYIGGLIGLVRSDGVVRNCSASGAAHCVEYDAGGLVGTNSGLIENSHASGRVSRAYYSHAYNDCGGFVGDNSGVIRNCFAKGDVHLYGQSGAGFVGWNQGRIESSYCLGDVHDQTDGYGGTASAFCVENGRDAVGTVYPTNVPGTLINCFATGKTVVHKELTLSGYPAGRPSRGFMASCGTNAVKTVNCSYRQVRPDTLMGIVGGVEELPEAYMKSQAFVDELNMYAALYGLSTWEYRAGDYPVQTGVKATNITDYLAGGSGTKEDPFLIETKQHLQNFREMVNNGEHFEGMYIRQTADIALNAPRAQWGVQMPEMWTAIGTMKFVTSYIPHVISEHSHTYYFRGTYDGDFHKIENMYIDDPAGLPAGLFGMLYHNAVIKNLSVTDAYVVSPGTHAGVAILASEVNRYANNVYISQCHTSGVVGDPDNLFWLGTASAIVNGIALEGDNWILNCSSSADVYAAEGPSAVTHQGGIGGTDTIGNFLFTGTLTKRCNMSYCKLMVPNNQDSWIVSENGYFDSEKFKPYNDVNNYNHLGRSTAYLQSNDFVNVLNDYVNNWNATHAYKLDYWQVQEGDYPRVNPNYQPTLTVTFESNGGTAITAKRVSENTHILMPAKPTKDGYIFAGWYEDAGFTKVFDFDSTLVTQSMTLYAKWLEPTYDEYDYSIFNNKFATEFHITNKAQLLGFVHAVNGIDGVLTPNNFKGKTVYLDCDILLNDTTDWEYWGKYTYAESWTPIGTGSLYLDPIHPFLGIFDGQGHVISGLYMDGNDEAIIELEEHGLFGYVGTKGETTVIRNLGLQASVADMRGNRIDSNIGLLAGVLRDGTIAQCFAQGKIVVDANSVEDIGGLIGQMGGINYNAGGVVTDCYSQVDIVYNPMDINATNRGVFGSGLVDWNNGSISNSYVAGGSWQEGVAGGTISNIYYNKELSPNSTANTGTALTTNEMHTKSSFAGFDFDSIWGRNDTINGGYPYLRCFYDSIIPDSPDLVKVTGISIGAAKTTITIGETLQLTAQTVPVEASVYPDSFAWTSSDENVLKVDQNGMVTAVGAGTATIMLTSSNPNLTATLDITAEHIMPSGIEIQSSDEDATIEVGDTCTLTAILSPNNTTMREIAWTLRYPADSVYLKLIPDGESCKVVGLSEGRCIHIDATSVGKSSCYNYYILTITATAQSVKPQLSNDSVYHVTQPYRNNTAWMVEKGGSQLISNMQAGAENRSNDARQQFAFHTFDNGETYYLYHEAEQKYIHKDGSLGTQAIDPVSFMRGAYENTFIVYFDNTHYINVNDYGTLVINYWNTPDGGNSCVITAVPKYTPTYYTVTFLDWDRTELHIEQVEQGKSATAPAAPTRDGYTFVGWDKDFSNVQSDLTVTAQYEQDIIPDNTITVRLNPASASTWSNVYLYSWCDGGALQPCGAWPGMLLNKDNEGWWSYTFDSKITTVNIIWNNGTGQQTVDITNVTQSTCYNLDGGGEKYGVVIVDCPNITTSLEDIPVNNMPKASKVIENNTLYIILPDGSRYTILGNKIE